MAASRSGESRDVDLRRLRSALLLLRTGGQVEYAFPNRKSCPIGVAGQIVPWNFPLLMLSWKIAPALATGNTVVLQPAETTPLSALLFADVLRQAELPPGVVNIVTGDGRTRGAPASIRVDEIAFTGSTAVGKSIQRELVGTRKRLTLELGGKAANVIFDDAALDQAVEGIVNGIYFNQARLLRGLAAARPGVDLRAADRQVSCWLATLRGRSARQEHRRRRDQLPPAARQDHRARGLGRGGGGRHLPAALPPAREGLLVRADRLHERRAELPDRAGGDLRACAHRAHLPDA